MVIDKNGYIELIQYLTHHLEIFELSENIPASGGTIMEIFEEQLAAQIILVCGQHGSLSFSDRNRVIREVDAIVYDLEEILAKVADHRASDEQIRFITEFSALIKNLFDNEIISLTKEKVLVTDGYN
ncbi:DUF3802 family protein [Shewanella sp. AS1]|uniref:DUF3802 family protein n=1 Tax=Shewanella sp. AS1 TaxID=2907626 RepID=UPI001F1FBB6A|nr:DUF3802 family protein [Shewanella sp. AS1]MCE9678635.1 DUF3802 family protein [Shewanella sp. AS1]